MKMKLMAAASVLALMVTKNRELGVQLTPRQSAQFKSFERSASN